MTHQRLNKNKPDKKSVTVTIKNQKNNKKDIRWPHSLPTYIQYITIF